MVTRPRPPAATVVVALALLAAACGGGASDNTEAGDIPDNQVFVTYAPPGGGFSVKVPEGWSRTEAGGVVTFTDKFNSVRVETGMAPDAPTVDSVRRDVLPAVGAAPGKVAMVTRPAGEAILATYQADGVPDPVTAKVPRLAVERYQFWRDGRTVVLTLSGAVGSDNVDPWKIVSESFRWV